MRTLTLSTAILFILAACSGGAGSAAPSPASSPSAGIVDAVGDWRLVEGSDGGAAIPLVKGSDVTMTVSGSQVSGRSACNLYGGEIIVVDGEVRFGAMFMTEMACDEPIMASEAAFMAAMGKVRAARRDGERLTLTGAGVTLVFEWVEPPPTADIVDTTWVLDSIITGDAVSSVMGDPATLVLAADGALTGTTGCRSFTGRYTEANGEIRFVEFAMDQTDCDPGLAAQDSHVVSVLGDGFRATVEGQRLTLSSTGNIGLGYTVAP